MKKFGDLSETRRMSAGVKLQRAFEREQEKSKASRERAQHEVKPWNQPNYNQSIEARQKAADMKKEEVELTEGKMGELHADIGQHLDKHIDNYKKVGGAEHLGSKTVSAAKKIAKTHNLQPHHAQKFVNDYVETKLKEDVVEESMEEKMAQKEYRKARKTETPPFDPDPPKKKPSVVPGKFGSGYSTARHLARQAMQRFTKPLKEDDELSQKAKIVKGVIKSKKSKKDVADEKNDTFQSEPILSKSQTRNY